MKVKSILVFSFVVVLLAMSNSFAEDKKESKDYVKVIYFHGDYRCATCNKLEAYSKETIEKYFSNELGSGKVKWDAINFDKKENKHYLDDFKLYNKALIIIRYENGKQKEWKNLEKIWEKASDKSSYFKYVKNEITKYIKEI
jgi:hypothetical protein